MIIYTLDVEFNPDNKKSFPQYYTQTYFNLDEAEEEYEYLISLEDCLAAEIEQHDMYGGIEQDSKIIRTYTQGLEVEEGLNKLQEDKEELILSLDDTDIICSEISKNLASEADAIEGYFKLLPYLQEDKEAVAHIKEIISDEKNHIELLNAIMLKYDRIHPNKS